MIARCDWCQRPNTKVKSEIGHARGIMKVCDDCMLWVRNIVKSGMLVESDAIRYVRHAASNPR